LEVLGFVRKLRKNYRENSKEDPEASVESIIKKALKTYKIKFKKTDCMYKLCTFGAVLWFSSVGSGK
jgi:hypothetical protein